MDMDTPLKYLQKASLLKTISLLKIHLKQFTEWLGNFWQIFIFIPKLRMNFMRTIIK